MFGFKKKEIKELNQNGQVLAITMGTIFAVGMGTAAMLSTYELAEKLVGNKKPVCEAGEEDDD